MLWKLLCSSALTHPGWFAFVVSGFEEEMVSTRLWVRGECPSESTGVGANHPHFGGENLVKIYGTTKVAVSQDVLRNHVRREQDNRRGSSSSNAAWPI